MAPEPLTKRSSSRAWEALTPPLSEWILDATASMGFGRMTPVQASTIPLFMTHKDVVVEAVTGSGKTLAFLIPVVEKLLRIEEPIKRHHVGAIIVSPTRELATQIYNVLVSLLKFHGPSTAVLKPPDDESHEGQMDIDGGAKEEETPIYPASTLKILPQLLVGGKTATVSQDLQHFMKHSPNILIATPGRLVELLSSPRVHTPQSSFEMLILDEADRLLSLGFQPTLQKILSLLPKQRRTGLFSASVSEAVSKLILVGLRNPVKVSVKVKSQVTDQDLRVPTSLELTYMLTPPRHKLPALNHILNNLSPTPQKSIIYVSTCATVDYLSTILPILIPKSFTLIPLHGKQPPQVRTRLFNQFLGTTTPCLLLTTDLAARGLDIPSVDLTIQLSPPSTPSTYLHRSGRAGRAGRPGLSVLFLTPGREEGYIPFLAVRHTPIHPLSLPNLPEFNPTPTQITTTETTIRTHLLTDRTLHDKSQRSFVSYARFYSSHEAKSIFRITDLNFEDLGHAWGLLKLPKMPELKAHPEIDKTLGQKEIDWKNYTYKDKQREKRRLEKQEDESNKHDDDDTTAPRNANAAWSAQHAAHAKRNKRREQRHVRREKERKAKMTEEERARDDELEDMIEVVRKGVRRREEMEEEEWGGCED
ncbi:MAG: ATP-dependent rRNA helicase spb4 [Cirrosporium novae-zelandiae]|nr:MAG: ATP-dependent rRNA helicase spb4 [Cirrosporium novae-zelandiae]